MTNTISVYVFIFDEMSLFVYMMTNPHNTALYTGVTNDLVQRTFEHKTKLNPGFTSRYNCIKLVYFEEHLEASLAIKKEKQLKKWRRAWKEKLINDFNPAWKDLSEEWHDPNDINLALKLNSKRIT